jgi:phosphomannomutase/phosphoglucomutase
MLNPQIFRTYDIRGVIGEDFTPGSVEKIGKAYGTYLLQKGTHDTIVGHDVRSSSTQFAQSIIKGIISTGVNVYYIGTVITPTVYYARHHYDIDGGVMITASHNPPKYNGFKLCHGIKCIFGDELQKIYEIIKEGNFVHGDGTINILETATDEYIKAITQRIQLKRKLKVVVDTGNGTAGLIVPRLLRELGCEVITMYGDIDPNFPNHIPDPVKLDNHEELIREVKRHNADIGLMIDGDGDRVGTVDNRGNIWLGDMVLIALMRDYLPKNPGAKVIVEVKDSEAVVDECKRLGGVPIFWKTGHSLIDGKVAEEKAILAAEMSCHYWLTDNWYVFDDGVWATAQLLRILSEQDKSYAEFMADVPQYPVTPEYRVGCPEDKKSETVEKATEYFRQHCSQVIDVDGIRGYYEDGWFLVRQSNTQPILAIRCEARSPEGLEKIKHFVKEHMNSYPWIDLDWNRQYDAH